MSDQFSVKSILKKFYLRRLNWNFYHKLAWILIGNSTSVFLVYLESSVTQLIVIINKYLINFHRCFNNGHRLETFSSLLFQLLENFWSVLFDLDKFDPVFRLSDFYFGTEKIFRPRTTCKTGPNLNENVTTSLKWPGRPDSAGWSNR